MSLTALVRHPTPVRERMAADFPRPKLRLKANLLVPSLAPNRPLMGTAYDYLLRFQLMRVTAFATFRRWVAEAALERLSRFGDDGALILVGEEFQSAGRLHNRMERIIRRAKRLLTAFLAGEPLSSSLIRAAINLAHCDTYYRIGRLDERFGNPHPAQVQELRRLIEVTDLQQLVATGSCLLNPAFGEGSAMLGGADADLLIDEVLIDVKTTATLKIRTEDWRQIVAYAALNEHFPIGGGERPVAIRRLGFYFSRYAYLVTWPLEELVDRARFNAFAEWLRDYAHEARARRLARRAQLAKEMAERKERERRRMQRKGAQRMIKRSRTRSTARPKRTRQP